MSVKDARKAPFVWASVEALAHLRREWNADRAEVRPGNGLAIYHALTEIANEDRARESIGEDSGRFRTSKTEIAERACVSGRSAERACRELQEIGLLLIEHDREGENRPGRPSYYTLLEPSQTYDRNSHVPDSKRTTEIRTPCDSSSHVTPGTCDSSSDPPNNRKKNSKKEEVCSTAVVALPQPLEGPLLQAAEAKDAVLDRAAIQRACEALPDRDHIDEAEKFAAWHLHGNGKNAPLRNVAQGFRNWLKRAPGDRKGVVLAPPASTSSPVVESEKATSAWGQAKKLLAEQLKRSTFRVYFEPLEVAGERDGRLVLVDTSDQGVGSWLSKKYRAVVLEAVDGFDDFELVDEKQLEMEAE